MAKRKHKTQRPPLSAQDIRFARLLFDRDATKKTIAACYLEAGFPAGASDNATNVAAHLRLKKPTFRAFYRELQDRAADSALVDAGLVVQLLKRIATFDVRQLYDDRGRIRLPRDWPDALAAGVLAVDSDEVFEHVDGLDPDTGKRVRRKELAGYTRKVKRVPPLEAIKLLAQILRMVGPDAGAEEAKQTEGVPVELVTRILATLGTRQPQLVPGGTASPQSGDAVGAEPGAAEPGVPQ